MIIECPGCQAILKGSKRACPAHGWSVRHQQARAATQEARARIDTLHGRDERDAKSEILRAIEQLRVEGKLAGEQGLVLEAAELYLKEV